MKKSMVIYLLTDTTNGKQYVGKTTGKLGKRIRQHRRTKHTYVDRMIGAHGWENCTVEILDECATPAELNEREIYRIATLGTRAPNGYNLTEGGEGSSGYKFTQESIQRLSLSHRMYHIVCVETGMIFDTAAEAAAWAGVQKAAIFRACNGISRTAGGYHWFYQEAPHLADHKPKVRENKNKRAVICVETGQIFESVSAAAKWAGVGKASIIRACNKKHRLVKGYHWQYADDPNYKVMVNRAKRAVRCVETGEVFESITEAANWAGVNPMSIARACKNNEFTSAGYHWQYVGEALYSAERKFRGRQPISIMCIETGEVFRSITEAAKRIGLTQATISEVIDKDDRTAGGFHWRRV